MMTSNTTIQSQKNGNKILYGSIHEVCQSLKAEGILVSEYMVRRAVKQGVIRARYSGIKAIICRYDVLEYLQGDSKPVA